METVGQRIQNIRIKRNLTQEAVAELLGVDPTTISRWETNVTMPSIRNRNRLCEIFRKQYHQLFGDILTEELPRFPPQPIHAPLSPQPRPNEALVELQIAIPVTIISGKELVERLQQSIRMNGKQVETDQVNIQPDKEEGNIIITARLYAPTNGNASPLPRESGTPGTTSELLHSSANYPVLLREKR